MAIQIQWEKNHNVILNGLNQILLFDQFFFLF